jgi:hypothetical protein
MKPRLLLVLTGALALLLSLVYVVLAETRTITINKNMDVSSEGVFSSWVIPTNWVEVVPASVTVSNFSGGTAADLTNDTLASGLVTLPNTNAAGSAHHDYAWALIQFATPQVISRVRWSWADVRPGTWTLQGWTGTNTPVIGITTNDGVWQTVGVYAPTNYPCATNGSFYQTNNVWNAFSNYNTRAFTWYQVRVAGYDTGALAAGLAAACSETRRLTVCFSGLKGRFMAVL